MRVRGISLDPLEVREAKRRFEVSMSYGCARFSLSFQETLKRLLEQQSQGHIAEAGGVSRQAFNKIYRVHFRSLLPDRRDEATDRVIRSLERCARLERKMPKRRVARRVAERARKNHLSVRQILISSGKHPRFKIRILRIGGKICGLHHVTDLFQTRRSLRLYSRLSVAENTLRGVSAKVVWQETEKFLEHFFVIPSSVLIEMLDGRREATVYLPTKRLPAYNGMVAAIDWWQYEDAWHILVSD